MFILRKSLATGMVIVFNIQEHLFVPLTFRNIFSLQVFNMDDDNKVGGIMKR